MKLKLVDAKREPSREEIASNHLSVYEQAEMEINRLKEDNSILFARLEELETVKKESTEALRRLFYTKDGPPGGIDKKSIIWATGDVFSVEVQYKRRADYYDPKLLPSWVLKSPGVVSDVDKDAVTKLVAIDHGQEIGAAFKRGDWMTPTISIKRSRDNKSE
jgi:hypothetical protein